MARGGRYKPKSFMVGCTEGEEIYYDYCSCVFSYLRNRLTLEEILELGYDVAAVNEAGSADYPTIILEAAEVCYESNNG